MMTTHSRRVAAVVMLSSIFLFAIRSDAGSTKAGDRWHRVTEDEGVVVWLEKGTGGGRSHFRGVGFVDADIYHLLAIIADIDLHPEWVFGCKEARIVARYDLQHFVVYSRLDVPWPFSDRDFVVDAKGFSVVPDKQLLAQFSYVTSPKVPPASGVVRAPWVKGRYQIDAIAPRKARVTMDVEFDPGGWIPGWLAEMANEDIPIQTIVGLRKQASRTLGRYLDYIEAIKRAEARPANTSSEVR